MKRLVCFLVIFFLFLQVFAEASLDGAAAAGHGEDEDGGVAAMLKLKKIKPHKPHKPKTFITPKINCAYACARRCSKSSRKHLCIRACGGCCTTCQCVPPGTYGNKELCPCYATLRTHGNKPKCP